MDLTAEEICCIKIKAEACAAKLGVEISVKESAGYCVDALYEKLKYVLCLDDIISDIINAGTKTFKNNIIYFCNKKVFASKNNSLFLDNIDSQDECKDEAELTEECCIDICNIESKLNEICSNC
jgi:hypothetical protein